MGLLGLRVFASVAADGAAMSILKSATSSD